MTAEDFGTGQQARQDAYDCEAIDTNYPVRCWNSDVKGFPEISFNHWMNHNDGGIYSSHHMLPKCYPGQCADKDMSDFTSRSAADACGRLPGDTNCYSQDKPYKKWTVDRLYNDGKYNLVKNCYPDAFMPGKGEDRDCWVYRDGALKKIENRADIAYLDMDNDDLWYKKKACY